MDEGGPFLRRPGKGGSRIWGLSTCEDCRFEARGEISVTEDEGVMRRRCEACGCARYPGLVEDWTAFGLAWIPEMTQASVSHLCRTLKVLEHLASEEGATGNAFASAVAGAKRVAGCLAVREGMLRQAMAVRRPNLLAGRLDALGVDARSAMRSGMRLVPLRLPDGRAEAWTEAGTFHGLTAEAIELTGGFHGR